MNTLKRCAWVPNNNPHYQKYHDEEWGIPVFDDQVLFEFLILEGAQAGLSWETILKKRNEYKKVFHSFSIKKVAAMTDSELHTILENPGIIRNKLKVFSTRKNAIAVLKIQSEFGRFSNYLWLFVNNTPIKHGISEISQIPTQSPESLALSKDLKKRGCTFVGPTIMYAFMQAVGMVDDHTSECFKYPQIQ